MKYIKALGLTEKKKLDGYYNCERNTIVVDFSQGILQALLTSYHEFLHKILDFLPIEDWLDLFSPLLSDLKNPKMWVQTFKIVFLIKHQHYYPLEDEQRVVEKRG